MAKRKYLTEEQKKQVIELFKSGMPYKQMIEITGLSHSSIYKIASQAGLTPRNVTPERDIEEAIRLYKETDLTIDQITERTGVCRPTLYRELKRRGS